LLESAALFRRKFAANVLPNRAQFFLDLGSDQGPDFANAFLAFAHDSFDALALAWRQIETTIQFNAKLLAQHPRLDGLDGRSGAWAHNPGYPDRPCKQPGNEDDQCGQYDLPGTHQESTS
jgi:hypothetical protein